MAEVSHCLLHLSSALYHHFSYCNQEQYSENFLPLLADQFWKSNKCNGEEIMHKNHQDYSNSDCLLCFIPAQQNNTWKNLLPVRYHRDKWWKHPSWLGWCFANFPKVTVQPSSQLKSVEKKDYQAEINQSRSPEHTPYLLWCHHSLHSLVISYMYHINYNFKKPPSCLDNFQKYSLDCLSWRYASMIIDFWQR